MTKHVTKLFRLVFIVMLLRISILTEIILLKNISYNAGIS